MPSGDAYLERLQATVSVDFTWIRKSGVLFSEHKLDPVNPTQERNLRHNGRMLE